THAVLMPLLADARAQLLVRGRAAERIREEPRTRVPAARGGVLRRTIEHIPVLLTERAVHAEEPLRVDGAVEQVIGRERCAFGDLALPYLEDVGIDGPATLLRMRVQP